MAIKDITTIKIYFKTGKVPTELQFIDFIDTVFDMANRLGIKSLNSGDIGDGKVLAYDLATDTVKYKDLSGLVGTKEVDETNIGDEKVLVYNSGTGKIQYTLIPSDSGKIATKDVNETGIVDGSILVYDNANAEWIIGTLPEPLTDAQIKAQYENNADTNAFTDAEKTKLGTIEENATADMTDAEIKTAYENNADTNAFTDAEKTKLTTLESLYDYVVDTIADKDLMTGLTAGETIFVRENGQVYIVGASGSGADATLVTTPPFTTTVPDDTAKDLETGLVEGQTIFVEGTGKTYIVTSTGDGVDAIEVEKIAEIVDTIAEKDALTGLVENSLVYVRDTNQFFRATATGLGSDAVLVTNPSYNHIVADNAAKDSLTGLTPGNTIFVEETGKAYIVTATGNGVDAVEIIVPDYIVADITAKNVIQGEPGETIYVIGTQEFYVISQIGNGADAVNEIESQVLDTSAQERLYIKDMVPAETILKTSDVVITDSVRYVRDWIQGSIAGSTEIVENFWIELQAIEKGTNINRALGIPVSSNYGLSNPENVTNGIIDNNVQSYGTDNTLQYVEVDLGNVYNIAEVKVYHYYGNSRAYHNAKTEVSADGITWITLFDSTIDGEYIETNLGRTHLTTIPGINPIFLYRKGISPEKENKVYKDTVGEILGLYSGTTDGFENPTTTNAGLEFSIFGSNVYGGVISHNQSEINKISLLAYFIGTGNYDFGIYPFDELGNLDSSNPILEKNNIPFNIPFDTSFNQYDGAERCSSEQNVWQTVMTGTVTDSVKNITLTYDVKATHSSYTQVQLLINNVSVYYNSSSVPTTYTTRNTGVFSVTEGDTILFRYKTSNTNYTTCIDEVHLLGYGDYYEIQFSDTVITPNTDYGFIIKNSLGDDNNKMMLLGNTFDQTKLLSSTEGIALVGEPSTGGIYNTLISGIPITPIHLISNGIYEHFEDILDNTVYYMTPLGELTIVASGNTEIGKSISTRKILLTI